MLTVKFIIEIDVKIRVTQRTCCTETVQVNISELISCMVLN